MSSLIGMTQIRHLNHKNIQPQCAMKTKAAIILFALFILVAIVLIRPWKSQPDPTTAAPASPSAPHPVLVDSTAELPDSLFHYDYFASTGDSAMFGSKSIPECSENVRANCLPELEKAFFPPIAGAIANLLHFDAAWVVQAINLVPLSKIKLPNGFERLVFSIGGDDFSGVVLVNKPPKEKANYALLLNGGIYAGPNYEDDSLTIWPVDIDARLAADSLIKTYRHEARFNDSTRGSIADSGRIALLLKGEGIDTISKEGITKTGSFLETRFNIKGNTVEEW